MNFLNVFLVGVFTMSLIPAEEAFACKGYQQSQYDRKRDQLKKLEAEHKKALARCDGIPKRCDGILRTVGKTVQDATECKLNALEDANKCKIKSGNSNQKKFESLKSSIDLYRSKGCK